MLSACNWLAASWSDSALRPVITMAAPCWPRARATARPMPRLAPVTSARRPVKVKASGMSLPRLEVQVLCDPGSILAKRFREQADAPFGFRQAAGFESDVEQIDVPR